MTVTIERVEVVCLQDPQAPYYRFEGSYRNVVVIAQGDNGLTGIGESDAPPEIVKAAIEMAPYNHLAEGLGAIVTGQTVDDPPRLWGEMYSRTRWFGRRGVAICAISALDIAIWDLFAQSKGVPVCEALGGARHARLPAYATIYPLESELERIDAQVAPLLEQGFRHLKVCVESWWAEPARVRRNLTHLRDLVGQDRGLMLDVAQEYTRLEQLAPYLDLLADLDFAWIEAPFPLDDVEEHARLRATQQPSQSASATWGLPPARSSSPFSKPTPSTSRSPTSRCSAASRRRCGSCRCWKAPAGASCPTPTTPTSRLRPIFTFWPRSRRWAWSSIRRVRHACGRASSAASRRSERMG